MMHFQSTTREDFHFPLLARQLRRHPSPKLHAGLVKSVLERKQKGSGDDTLRDLGPYTYWYGVSALEMEVGTEKGMKYYRPYLYTSHSILLPGPLY